MGKQRSGWAGTALNAMLLVLGLVALYLLYAFITSTFIAKAPPPSEVPEASTVDRIVQVDVRNGCGVAGIAAETTRFLRHHGFDVVEAGNHTSFDLEESVVLDRAGDLEAAHRVAAALGIPEEQVRQEIRPDYYLDASVIIGHDYATLAPFSDD